MDKDRLNALKQKRLNLKRVERERSMRELASDLVQVLDSKSIEYSLSFDSDVWSWVCDKFPVHNWGQINWEKIQGATNMEWQSAEDRSTYYEQIISDNELGNELVTVIWSNAERPAFRMSLEDSKSIAEELFDEDLDTWVVSKENHWCIECHHNGHIALAK
jgi:hypothetical protein